MRMLDLKDPLIVLADTIKWKILRQILKNAACFTIERDIVD